MHGNAREWCQDWFGEYPGGGVVDPRGPASGSARVIRGGSYWIAWPAWGHDAGPCRSAGRDFDDPGPGRRVLIGIRPVLAPGQQGKQSSGAVRSRLAEWPSGCLHLSHVPAGVAFDVTGGNDGDQPVIERVNLRLRRRVASPHERHCYPTPCARGRLWRRRLRRSREHRRAVQPALDRRVARVEDGSAGPQSGAGVRHIGILPPRAPWQRVSRGLVGDPLS